MSSLLARTLVSLGTTAVLTFGGGALFGAMHQPPASSAASASVGAAAETGADVQAAPVSLDANATALLDLR